MALSRPLHDALEAHIRARWGNDHRIERAAPVSGGDINDAFRLDLTDSRALFAKTNAAPLPGLFEAEARGLGLLREAGALRVPDVYAWRDADESPAFILMEWIEPDRSGNADAMRSFGRGLAELHRTRGQRYGLDHDNYIGSLPQENAPAERWIDFYRDRRLGVQRGLAQRNGLLPSGRARKLDRFMESLDRFIDEAACVPSTLHGDLWGGNYLVSDSEAVLIDPAVYHGHREAELAFTELFGGFPAAFYESYHEVWPLPAEYDDRKALYQLYPLLVHLNLFGEAYGARVDQVLTRYAGPG